MLMCDVIMKRQLKSLELSQWPLMKDNHEKEQCFASSAIVARCESCQQYEQTLILTPINVIPAAAHLFRVIVDINIKADKRTMGSAAAQSV